MSDPTPVAAPTPTPAGTPTPTPQQSIVDLLAQLQSGLLARGSRPGAPNPVTSFAPPQDLLGGLFGGGPGRVVPGTPSPGIGPGIGYPGQYEDGSYGYDGSYRDRLMLLMESLINRRFPNGE